MILSSGMSLLPNLLGSPPPGALDLVCFGVCFSGIALVAVFLLTLSVAHVMTRLKSDQHLGGFEQYQAFIAPHFFLGTALVLSVLRSPSWLASGFQGAGLVALMGMLAAAIHGSRQRLVAVFSRPRLIALGTVIAALWVAAFVLMLQSPHSIERWFDRAHLISPLASFGVVTLWLSLVAGWKVKVKGIDSAARYEGIWRKTEGGFALDTGEETLRVEVPAVVQEYEDAREGERCVVFLALPRKSHGPFRGEGPLVAGLVVAGTMDDYRASLGQAVCCVHIVALCALWALAYSAMELVLRAVLVLS